MKKALSFYSKILASLLTLLGFTYGCIEPRVEYGSPHADYVVKGKVVNKADKKPVKGIHIGFDYARLVAMYGVVPSEYREMPYVLTDEKGNYELKYSGLSPDYADIDSVFIYDIDGLENGGYFHDTIVGVDFDQAIKTKKSDGWYEGEFTVTQNVELRKLEDE
ncbi:hypothetical protein AGMMS50262_04390 [Bacteroidia bacterium]|nr:hypothetical protein AGMMS50262_04390 [Bacteroidia bacterium]